MENIDNFLKSLGINDFDDLTTDEKDSYFKLLDLAEKTKITLEDVIKHVHQMRLSVEFALVDEDRLIFSKTFPFLRRKNPRLITLQARLKNYILLESLFDRPERAKEMLDQYTKIRNKK